MTFCCEMDRCIRLILRENTFHIRTVADIHLLERVAGLSGERAAAILGADRARISNIETGRIDVSRNRLNKVLQE